MIIGFLLGVIVGMVGSSLVSQGGISAVAGLLAKLWGSKS